MKTWLLVLGIGLAAAAGARQRRGEKGKDNTPPPGFTAVFNGKDLSGWQAILMEADAADTTSKKPQANPRLAVAAGRQ